MCTCGNYGWITHAGGVEDSPRGPLELWVAETATGKARKLLDGLNTVFDECGSPSHCRASTLADRAQVEPGPDSGRFPGCSCAHLCAGLVAPHIMCSASSTQEPCPTIMSAACRSQRAHLLVRRYTWVDGDTIIANVIPEGVGAPPVRPPAPTGPRIQDNATGAKVPHHLEQ